MSAHASGKASHLGRFVAEGSRDSYGEPSYGVFTAANGDQVFYEDEPVGGLTYVVTGGTGRFAGAAGSFTVFLLAPPIMTSNPDGTVTVNLQWTAVGTITY